MRREARKGALACAAAMALLAPLAAAGQEDYPDLTREEELRLAISAGPLTVSQDADVYVMGERGFEKAIEGENGWACLVVRSARNRSVLAPHCLNPPAAETALLGLLREGELQAQGMEAEAIDETLLREYERGMLPLPQGPAYAYMLSEGQWLGERAGNFEPHFMLYVPYATNESIGGDPSRQEFPFVGPYSNHPLSTVVIIMDEFVRPADVKLPG